MSSEITPVEEGNATSSSTKVAQNSSDTYAVQPWDLLDVRTTFNLEVFARLTGGDYHTKQYLASKKGHVYTRQSDPTLISVRPVLDQIKEPSVLLLRGCELLLQSGGFPFDKFKSLTTLEISDCPHLTTLPLNTISQMNQLQSLDLSHLQIDQLPNDMFENSADSLRSLVIRSCPNLRVLPEPPRFLEMLTYLDLSRLPIETLPANFIFYNLRSITLRGCSELYSLDLRRLGHLYLLDLSHCSSLMDDDHDEAVFPRTVEAIDLSYTGCCWKTVPMTVSHLIFKNAKLCNPKKDSSILTGYTEVCDLSGNQGLGDVSVLGNCLGLKALNLSRTAIESIDFLPGLTHLRTLVLRECTMLERLPSIEQLENLEVLDLSGCEILGDLPQGLSKQRRLKELNLCGCKGLTELMEGLFDDMLCLEKLDLSNTNIKNLPSFDELIIRGTVINHSCDSALESITVPTELSDPVNLCSDNVDSRHEFHLVTTFISNSGFDNFKYKFIELKRYLLFLEEKCSRNVIDAEASGVKRRFRSMHVDLEYILGKVDILESYQNCRSSEKLLHKLMSYDYQNYDEDPSSILKKLLRTVTKLKVLILPPPPPPLEIVGKDDLYPAPITGFKRIGYLKDNLDPTDNYESLTTIQRNCLLYFACLTHMSGTEMLWEHILIHLWYGEGFFDPLLYANSTSNLLPEMSSGSPRRNDADQQASTSSNTIEKIGRDILQALDRKDFIYINKRRCYFTGPYCSFAITKAMEEQSFDFNKHGKLTPHFGVSRRACLLKSDIDHLPSSQVWLNYTKSSKQLESFKTVRTLLYIDELVVDINTQWFSAMTNLQVLHLVNLYSEQQINIVDLKFLEELKRMKQLRLLSLESFAAIEKLPDSICQLTNLRILNLAYCSNMKELPVGIASLTNLIILDLTECHLLPQLPKGLASLSKLEVLKGFAITYKVSGRQSKKACTLRELLKLEKLRKLNLVVNRDSFPDTRDLQVLRNMKELRNLKITWKKNIYKEEELGDAVEKGALRQFRWKQLKCWGAHNETEEVDDELLLTNISLGDLNKLVLCCVPFETEPNWLHPTELQNLEKLYIVGGSLRTLFQGFTDQTTWNIQNMKLMYLSNLQLYWLTIQGSFPCFKSRHECGCPHVKDFFLFDSRGIIDDED